jgi:chromosome segregation ATPase
VSAERVKELEARLRDVMKERGAIETAIRDAKEQGQVLRKRASEIHAKEGVLRKQIGDLRSVLDAAGK